MLAFRAMNRLALVLCLLGATAALAGSAEKRAEVGRLIGDVAEGRLGAAQAETRLAFLGQDAYACSFVLDALRKVRDPQPRAALIEVLAQVAVPSPDVEGTLVRALAEDSLGLRMAAIRGLARARAFDQVPRLEGLLGDKLMGVRREAARALGTLARPSSAGPLLAQARAEQDPETRAAVLLALGKTAGKKELPELEKFLASDSELTRLAAAQALCAQGNQKGLAFAKKLLTSVERTERLQGVRLFEGAPLKAAQAALAPALTDPDTRVRAVAARVLYQAGEASRLDFMVLESARAQGDARLPWEDELERLRLSDEARAAILKKAGLK